MASFGRNWPLAAPPGPRTARNQHLSTAGSSGLRIPRSGLRIQGSRLKAQSLALKAQGSKINAQGSELSTWAPPVEYTCSGFQDQGSGFRAHGLRLRAWRSRLRTQRSKLRAQSSAPGPPPGEIFLYFGAGEHAAPSFVYSPGGPQVTFTDFRSQISDLRFSDL